MAFGFYAQDARSGFRGLAGAGASPFARKGRELSGSFAASGRSFFQRKSVQHAVDRASARIVVNFEEQAIDGCGCAGAGQGLDEFRLAATRLPLLRRGAGRSG